RMKEAQRTAGEHDEEQAIGSRGHYKMPSDVRLSFAPKTPPLPLWPNFALDDQGHR
ncbi:hypothetical protein V5O48_018968, partial [Marasmius crinis-equi]